MIMGMEKAKVDSSFDGVNVYAPTTPSNEKYNKDSKELIYARELFENANDTYFKKDFFSFFACDLTQTKSKLLMAWMEEYISPNGYSILAIHRARETYGWRKHAPFPQQENWCRRQAITLPGTTHHITPVSTSQQRHVAFISQSLNNSYIHTSVSGCVKQNDISCHVKYLKDRINIAASSCNTINKSIHDSNITFLPFNCVVVMI